MLLDTQREISLSSPGSLMAESNIPEPLDGAVDLFTFEYHRKPSLPLLVLMCSILLAASIHRTMFISENISRYEKNSVSNMLTNTEFCAW